MKKVFILILLALFLTGCKNVLDQALDKTADAILEADTIRKKLGANEDLAKADCVKVCESEVAVGNDLSSGPCLVNPFAGLTDWVCDVAHNPRQAVDNEPKNQCSAYRAGKATHFVEVDESCNIINVQ